MKFSHLYCAVQKNKNVPMFKTEKCAAEFVCPDPIKGTTTAIAFFFQKIFSLNTFFSTLTYIFFFSRNFSELLDLFYSYLEFGDTSFKCTL